MEVFLMGIVTIAFAYVAKKLENLESKVDKLQEEVIFIHHITRKRTTDYADDVV